MALSAGLSAGLSSGSEDNLIDYSGFRYGDTGWSIEATDSVEARRTSPGALGSQYALEIESQREADVHMQDAQGLPTTRADSSYQGVLYVKSPLSRVTGTLTIREVRGGTVVGSAETVFTAKADWSRIVVSHDAVETNNDLLVSVDIDDMPGESPVVIDHLRLLATAPDAGGEETDPPTEAESQTLFGASVDQGSRTWDAAVSDSDTTYGRLDVVRVFYPGMPSSWPGRAGAVARPVVVSFKAQPRDVLSGTYDDELLTWFETAPQDRDIWWSYWHEPEDNVGAGDFTAQQWSDAFRRIAGLAQQANNPMLHSTVILMCWTVNPNSGRQVSDFFPGRDVVDTLAWDCYNKSEDGYADPATVFGRAIGASRDRGVDFGIAELGSKLRGDDDGALRAAWLRTVATHLSEQGAQFVTYFDALMPGGDFRLLDTASQEAWRDAVAG